MRRIFVLAATIVATTLGMLAAALPVRAQTYNPHYPVCLQAYAPFVYYDCHFFSIPECKASASGRGAQCVVNPYFVEERPPVRRGRRTG